jgi:nanoRNase/pAp phosphatase (c-di-AMP/oligoRNAs hydrolase)
MYYKHVMIVNYASGGINKLKSSLNDDAKVVIYDHHMFIVQIYNISPDSLRTFADFTTIY